MTEVIEECFLEQSGHALASPIIVPVMSRRIVVSLLLLRVAGVRGGDYPWADLGEAEFRGDWGVGSDEAAG